MISITFVLFLFTTVAVCEDIVQYAAVIYRHGDRTPVDPYPTDPWRNESLWPVKFGELTNVGKRQHYALGQWLRKRYSRLLSTKFDPSEIYIRSTDVDRTLMSAQANLAGLYPPSGETIWNPLLMWQPIPVHTVPEKDDEILAMKKECAVYTRNHEEYMHSKAYKDRLSKYQDLMDYLSAYTGKKVKDYYDIVDIYSTLYIESLNNFTLPNWTQSVYPDKLREPACYSFTTPTGTPLLARLKVGPFMQQIVNMMKDVISGSGKHHKPPRVAMFSAHDLNIGSILNALDMYDGNCPVYTSTIFMELIYNNTTSDYFIRISYRNSTEIVEPNILNIPYCGQLCPVDKFVRLYDNLLSVNWNVECGNEPSFQFSPVLAVAFFVGLGLFAMIYIVHRINFIRFSRENTNNTTYMVVNNTLFSSVKSVEP